MQVDVFPSPFFNEKGVRSLERNFVLIWMNYASQLIARQKEKLSHNRFSIYGVILLLSVIVLLFIDIIEVIQGDPEANFLLAFTFVSVFNFSGVFSLVLLTFLIQNSQSHQAKIKEILDSFSKYFLELPFYLLVISICLANFFDGALARNVGLGRSPYFAYVLFWFLLGSLVFFPIRKENPTFDPEQAISPEPPSGILGHSFRRKLFGFLLLLSCLFLILSMMAFHDLVVFSGLFKKLVFLKASFLLTFFFYLAGFLLFLLSADYNIGDFKKIEHKLLLESPEEDEIRFFFISSCFDGPLKDWTNGIIDQFSTQKKELSELMKKIRTELDGNEKGGKGKGVENKEKLVSSAKEKFLLLQGATRLSLGKIPQIIQGGLFVNQNEFLSELHLILSNSMKKIKKELLAL